MNELEIVLHGDPYAFIGQSTINHFLENLL